METTNALNTEATLQRPKRFTISTMEAAAVPMIATPPGYQLHDLERLLDRPTRQRGRLKTTTPMSFVAACEDGDDAEARIFIDERAGSFTGVLNYGRTKAPSWSDYVVSYQPAYSLEFEDWLRVGQGKEMAQAELVRFLEDHFQDIASMSGGEVLALVRDFRVSMNGSFSSATNLANGSIEFAYAMDNRGKGSIEVPEMLTIRVPVFDGTEPIDVPIRFRYRLNEARLAFQLELAGFPRIRIAEFRKIRALISEHLSGYQFIDGSMG